MDIEQFYDLNNRISNDSSVLLLGQNYLSLGSRPDPVWQELTCSSYADLNLSTDHTDYPALFQRAIQRGERSKDIIAEVSCAGKDGDENQAVSSLLALPWSLVFTSSVDDTRALISMPSIVPYPTGVITVSLNEETFHPEYLDKGTRRVIRMCGNQQTLPQLEDDFAWQIFQQDIATRAGWIQQYLHLSGVLVIDGLIPRADWLKEDILFKALLKMPKNSVFWFSAPQELGTVASQLVERGILITEQMSFYDSMKSYMPEFLEYQAARMTGEEPVEATTHLTLRLGRNKSPHVGDISLNRVVDLEQAFAGHLCLMDDEVLRSAISTQGARSQQLAEFLAQDGIPRWDFFNTIDDIPCFYVSRASDRALRSAVKDALRNKSEIRRPVILAGPSNSGKSMSLAFLAWSIAVDRQYPVVYIRGDFPQYAHEKLKDFIRDTFCETNVFSGETPSKTLVVWDGSGLNRRKEDYENLQKDLFTCNAQVVGSLYSSDGTDSAVLQTPSLNTEDGEPTRFRRMLASVDERYAQRFDFLLDGANLPRSLKNSSLFYLIPLIFRYEYDPEYRAIRTIMNEQFLDEQQCSEEQRIEYLRQNVESLERVDRKRHIGLAASLRIQIESDRAEREQAAEDPTPEDELWEYLAQLLERVSGFLAVASEFGISLPRRLLLRVLRKEVGDMDTVSQHIIKALQVDTLIESTLEQYGTASEDYYSRFRNSIEAEAVMCLLCDVPIGTQSDDPETGGARGQKEVEILLDLIRSAEPEDAQIITLLTRKFGANSHGKVSELENATGDYIKYAYRWLDIAHALKERFPSSPDATLTYAHFVREYIQRAGTQVPSCGNTQNSITITSDEIHELRKEVIGALLKELNLIDPGQSSEAAEHYVRLTTELCANYQQSLEDGAQQGEFDVELYEQIKTYLCNARNTAIDKSLNSERCSSNIQLHILLRAFDVYEKSNPPMDKFQRELIEINGYANRWFDLGMLDYMPNDDDLVKRLMKIKDAVDKEGVLTEEIVQNLAAEGNASGLIEYANRLWRKNITIPDNASIRVKFALRNPYTIIERDHVGEMSELHATLIEHPEIMSELRENAGAVKELLESWVLCNTKRDGKPKHILESSAVIAMLLRARWIDETGNLMLDPKQNIGFSKDTWKNINTLCELHEKYASAEAKTKNGQGRVREKPFVPPLLLHGVYEWIYGDQYTAMHIFCLARQRAGYRKQSNIQYLTLCSPESKQPRSFNGFIQGYINREGRRKYRAKIGADITPVKRRRGPADRKSQAIATDNVTKRTRIDVPKNVAKQLCSGMPPCIDETKNAGKFIIRFNLSGPQVALPEE